MPLRLLFALPLLLLPLPSGAQIAVDPFDDAGIATANSGASVVTSIVGGAMIGGERLMQAVWLAGPGAAVAEADRLGNGDFEFTTGAGTTGLAFVRYDGVGTPGPGLGIDATDAGKLEALRMRILSIDTPTQVTVSMGDAGGNIATATRTLPASLPTPAPVNFRFAAMTGGPGPVDFTDVDFITFEVEPLAAGAGFRAELVGLADLGDVPVPALGPAGLAALGLALVAAAAFAVARGRRA